MNNKQLKYLKVKMVIWNIKNNLLNVMVKNNYQLIMSLNINLKLQINIYYKNILKVWMNYNIIIIIFYKI